MHGWNEIVREFDVHAPDHWLIDQTWYDDGSYIKKGKDYSQDGVNYDNAPDRYPADGEWISFEERYHPVNGKFWESYTYYATTADVQHTLIREWDFAGRDWSHTVLDQLDADTPRWKHTYYDNHPAYSWTKEEWGYGAGSWSKRTTHYDRLNAQRELWQESVWLSGNVVIKSVVKQWDYGNTDWQEREEVRRLIEGVLDLESETILHDNGTFSVIDHDLGNANTVWNQHTVTYKSASRLPNEIIYEQYVYDDNKSLTIEKDLLGRETWKERTTKDVLSGTPAQWLTYYQETIYDTADGREKKVVHQWERPGLPQNWLERIRTYDDDSSTLVSRDEIVYSDTYKTIDDWDRLDQHEWLKDEKEIRSGTTVYHKITSDDLTYTITQRDYTNQNWSRIESKGRRYNNQEKVYFKATYMDASTGIEVKKEYWDPGDARDWEYVFVQRSTSGVYSFYTVIDGGITVPGEIPIDVVNDAWNGVGLRGDPAPDADRRTQDLSAFDFNRDGLINQGRELEMAGPLLYRLLSHGDQIVL